MSKNKKRADGRIQSKVFIGTIDGVSKYKYVYGKTQKEVDAKVLEIKLSLKKGVDVSMERDTFKDWAEQWLSLKKMESSYNWYVSCQNRADNLKPLYNMQISKIRTGDIQKIITDLSQIPRETTGKPYSKKTLSDLKNAAQAIFKLAIDNRLIDFNPASAVKLPKDAAKSTKRALTEDEQRWILNTPHRAQRAAMIMMYSGLRRGELIPLLWTDIDLKEGTISVNKTVQLIKDKPIVQGSAKTKKSIRIIYIPQKLIDFLSAEKRTSFFVCPNLKGGLMTGTEWKNLWNSYLTDLNIKYGDFSNNINTKGKAPTSKFLPMKIDFVIPRITAHWLRHTFITLMYFAGVDILTAKEQAGHSDIKTTMAIYTHLDSKFKKKSVSKLDEYLFKQKRVDKEESC